MMPGVVPTMPVDQFKWPYTTREFVHKSLRNNDLAHAIVDRRYVGNRGTFLLDRFRISHGECRLRSRPHSHTAGGRGPGQNNQEVAPHARDLFCDLSAGPGAHGDHGDHGPYPDDDAEHRKGRAHLVHPQGAEGDLEG